MLIIMTRTTTADKTIKGFYYQVIYAAYEVLALEDGDRLGCEIENSDFLVDKCDKGRISVEVKYYNSKIGWGSQALKNTIRNFLDLEKSSPETYNFELLTSAEKAPGSICLNTWEKVQSGNKKGLLDLIKEIKILYISQTTDIDVTQVRNNFEQYISTLCLDINFDSFINRVKFRFNYRLDSDDLRIRVGQVYREIIGEDALDENIDPIMYYLLDRVWRSVKSGKDSQEKYISSNEVRQIIVDRNNISDQIMEKGHIKEFKFAESYFNYMRAIIREVDLFEGNEPLEKKFFHQFDRIISVILDRYEKEEIIQFLESVKRYRIMPQGRVDTEELQEFIMYLTSLSLAVENDIEELELRLTNVIKNLKLNNAELGLSKIGNIGGSAQKKLLDFIEKRFIKNPPEDIQKLNPKDLIILRDFDSGYFCNSQCDQYSNHNTDNQQFLSKILSDIGDLGELDFKRRNRNQLGEKSLKDFMCEYHCGSCCQFSGRETLLENQQRIGRVVKNA